MISIDEARSLILDASATLLASETMLVHSVGLTLARDAISDVDSPPFDKSMMDGVAFRFEDFQRGQREFLVIGQVRAGSDVSYSVASSQCLSIMTGAPIPPGADTVVMIEETDASKADGNPLIAIKTDRVKKGQNILLQSATMRQGQTILPAGHTIRPHDIGVLAEGGAALCFAVPRPNISVIATGDELVPLDRKPGASQIRNSNSPMLAAMAAKYCGSVNDIGIVPDNLDRMRSAIESGLESNVLVLSGGVSAGVADLVPQVLREAGVEQVFHKVAIKPGKPIWFGVLKRDDRPNTLVFGLPGNPVSSMCCFHVFVRPALVKMAGRGTDELTGSAKLKSGHRHQPGRTVFWPSFVDEQANGREVTPLAWKGSADLLTLVQANCFTIFPGDLESFEAGELMQIFPLD